MNINKTDLQMGLNWVLIDPTKFRYAIYYRECSLLFFWSASVFSAVSMVTRIKEIVT